MNCEFLVGNNHFSNVSYYRSNYLQNEYKENGSLFTKINKGTVSVVISKVNSAYSNQTKSLVMFQDQSYILL